MVVGPGVLFRTRDGGSGWGWALLLENLGGFKFGTVPTTPVPQNGRSHQPPRHPPHPVSPVQVSGHGTGFTAALRRSGQIRKLNPRECGLSITSRPSPLELHKTPLTLSNVTVQCCMPLLICLAQADRYLYLPGTLMRASESISSFVITVDQSYAAEEQNGNPECHLPALMARNEHKKAGKSQRFSDSGCSHTCPSHPPHQARNRLTVLPRA